MKDKDPKDEVLKNRIKPNPITPKVFWEAQLTSLQLTYVSSSLSQVFPSITSSPTDLWKYIHPEDQMFVRQTYQSLDKPGLPQSIEYRIQLTTEQFIWVEDTFELYARPGMAPMLRGIIHVIDTAQENVLQIRENALRQIMHDIAHKTGQDYFQQMVLSLGQIIKADWLVIGEKVPGDECIRTIAVNSQGALQPNFNYSLIGAPCQLVLNRHTCIYPRNVTNLFPDDQILIDLQIEGYLGTPIFDSKGEILGLIVALYQNPISNTPYIISLFELFATHIGTEMNRLQSEIALKESEKRFKSFFKEDGAIKLLINPDTQQIIDANEAAERFYGYSYAEITQLSIADLNLLNQQNIIKALQQAKNRQKNHFHFQHRTKNKEIKEIETYSTPVEFEGVQYILATIHDITESVQNKQSLIKEKQFVDSIIQYATEGICVCYKTVEYPYLKFTVWNKQMEKITGYTLQEINKLGWYQTIYPHGNFHNKTVAQIREMHTTSHLMNITRAVIHKNSQKRLVAISSTTLNNEHNQPHTLAIMQDITQTNEAQKALKDRQARMQLLYQITSNASDEAEAQLQNALELTSQFFQADQSIISEVDNDSYAITQIYNPTNDLQKGDIVPLSSTICQETLKREEVVMIDNLSTHELISLPINSLLNIQSYLGTVLHVFGKKYGTICVTSNRPYTSFQTVDGEFINLLARWAGNLIERKLKEKDLKESEERYRLLTESSPMGILLHSGGQVKYVNSFGIQLLETTQEEIQDYPTIKIIHPDSVSVVNARIKELYEKKGHYAPPIEEKVITFKNHIRYFLVSGIAITYQGQPAICNVFADITELKDTEQELLQARNFLQDAQRIGKIGTWIYNITDNSQWWSNELYNIYGRDKQAGIPDKEWKSHVHPDDQERIVQAMNEAITTGQYICEYRLFKYDNLEERVIFTKAKVEYDVEGNPIRYTGIVQDITDQKKVEDELRKRKEQLEKANKELEELAYVASHDLKAPLANLQGLMMLMEDVEAVKNSGLEFFEKMQLSVKRMQNTLDNLNEVIAMKQDLSSQKEELQFAKIFQQVSASLETQVSEAQAIIQVDFSLAPAVLYPSLHLKSILQNLLTNAIKYRDSKRPLVVEVSTIIDKSQVCLIVKDNGLGMDLKKSKDKLFGLFKRLHIHVEGKGMGLYILKSIVDSHQGSIEVDSQLNQGTTFKIYLGND